MHKNYTFCYVNVSTDQVAIDRMVIRKKDNYVLTSLETAGCVPLYTVISVILNMCVKSKKWIYLLLRTYKPWFVGPCYY